MSDQLTSYLVTGEFQWPKKSFPLNAHVLPSLYTDHPIIWWEREELGL